MEQKKKENAITAPASHVPHFIPVQTVSQLLPFGELRWVNFEKVCYRLAGKDADVESHSLYGRTGQAQQGIDIFARKRNSRYNTWQAKCYNKYTSTNLKDACSTFLNGEWSRKTDVFYIAVQCAVDDVNLQDAIEEQAKFFRAQGISLIVLGGHDLSSLLREHPDIVLEFFGRECAKNFFGDTIDKHLLQKLDGGEIHQVRAQLQRVYQAGFELLDKIPVNTPSPFSDQPYVPISLLERFSVPDVLLKESSINYIVQKKESGLAAPRREHQPKETISQLKTEENLQTEQYRRTPIAKWLAESDRIAIIGQAGTGKSTVLRCMALDLLGDQERFSDVAKKWGLHLPLFISFAKWVRLTEANVEAVGIKELLRATWQQQLTADLVSLIDKAIDESRVVLFVDGLDEWANEQAARTTLQVMLTIVSAHNIPIIISARPGGLSKIGGIPDYWAVGHLAPLSKLQQREIATIWFSRNMEQNNTLPSYESVLWQTNRFFMELNKGRGLATLAETPLLLLGLIALAVRQLVLPLNKAQALNQLTELLLELHPYSRATAAGDVIPRFSIAASTDVRREALAALAFEIRSEGGDAGYPIQLARKCIKNFLTDPEGFSYSSREALEVASEILAVNSETMGLLVEKGREEVGFVHASIEEYLASVHIHGWPIERILGFVRENASNYRWRSVFGDLISRNNRRSEAEKIVRVIDEPESDAIGALHRRLLLSDVVFGGAEINKPTAIKISERSFDIISGSGWINERRAHLGAALEGIYNPSLREKTSTNIMKWGIRSNEYLQDFYRALLSWPRSDCLLNILKQGIKNDSVINSRTAAHTLAVIYKGDVEVEEWLISLLRGDNDLMVIGIVLEALTVGWPGNQFLNNQLNNVLTLKYKPLLLSIIWCKIQLNFHTNEDMKTLLNFISWHDEIDYDYRGFVGQCLLQGWQNNNEIIKVCLSSLNNTASRHDQIDKEIAQKYLMSCDANNPDICKWILTEIKSDHPFIMNFSHDWEWLLKFSETNVEIREQLVIVVTSEKSKYHEYRLRPIYSNIEDPRIKKHLIDKVRTSEDFSVYWAMTSLLEGKNSNDSDVKDLIQEILDWEDKRKLHVVSLFPKMFERDICIQELLRIIKSNEKIRSDLLISAFRQLNIESEKEIIDLLICKILSEPDDAFSGSNNLIALFPNEPRVKEYALSKLNGCRPPIALLASVYNDESYIHQKIAEKVGSLTITMRQQIIDAASNEFDRNDTAKRILGKYDHEADGLLKIHGAIKNYQALFPTDNNRQKVIEKLIIDSNSVGPDHDERRAAAFAGLIAYGATKQFVPLKWNDKPLDISLGCYGRKSQSLLRLIAENWDELDKNFDRNFLSRLNSFTSEPHFFAIIAPYISANSSLRLEFIKYCEKTTNLLAFQELLILAKELPKSDLLLRHCLSVINHLKDKNAHDTWQVYQSYFEAAYILRDHFGGNADLLNQLRKILHDCDYQYGVAAMAIYSPHDSSLDCVAKTLLSDLYTPRDYAVPIIFAASRFEAEQLGVLVKNMINRSYTSVWDFQDRINYALKSRIGSDSEFVSLISTWLVSHPTESEISSISRYLSSTGKLEMDTQELCLNLLNERNRSPVIPAHGFDALSTFVRPVVHSLLDVLAGPIH